MIQKLVASILTMVFLGSSPDTALHPKVILNDDYVPAIDMIGSDQNHPFTSGSEIISFCPENMVEIEGEYCPVVIQRCLDIDYSIHNVNGYPRCLQFDPTICLSDKIKMHFCIDKYEASDSVGEVPPVMISWHQAQRKCQEQNKRLCQDTEWTLACEGKDMLPYPYGLIRDSNACNIDKPQKSIDVEHSNMNAKDVAELDQRVPSGSMPRCQSEFGVFDMTGNVDEATINCSGKPYHSALKGGHWVKGARNRCRPATLAHNEDFANYETSYRCCKSL